MENKKLPGLNCGLCGFKSCSELEKLLEFNPQEIKRCIHLKNNTVEKDVPRKNFKTDWEDIYGREYDFILDAIDEKEGVVETIHFYNTDLISELKLKPGDVIMGRPSAAGCPVTHCGKIKKIDHLSSLIEWVLVGPIVARRENTKEIGSYAPVAFDGLVKEKKVELKIGMRYFWMPRRCMINWRHSGIISEIIKMENGYRVKIESVHIG